MYILVYPSISYPPHLTVSTLCFSSISFLIAEDNHTLYERERVCFIQTDRTSVKVGRYFNKDGDISVLNVRDTHLSCFSDQLQTLLLPYCAACRLWAISFSCDRCLLRRLSIVPIVSSPNVKRTHIIKNIIFLSCKIQLKILPSSTASLHLRPTFAKSIRSHPLDAHLSWIFA